MVPSGRTISTAADFQNRHNFSNSIGAIAGKYNLMQAPPNLSWVCAPEIGAFPHVIVGDKAFSLKTYLLRPTYRQYFRRKMKVYYKHLHL
ncbi:uncharacterized protein LOC143223869 [Tachypleus tridentatus]|uniref:uncharacterized protein LOC143223869 n=1 Tax=Tachypleus tridentatus TaxID=6853 RepID=UPI003FD15617